MKGWNEKELSGKVIMALPIPWFITAMNIRLTLNPISNFVSVQDSKLQTDIHKEGEWQS